MKFKFSYPSINSAPKFGSDIQNMQITVSEDE